MCAINAKLRAKLTVAKYKYVKMQHNSIKLSSRLLVKITETNYYFNTMQIKTIKRENRNACKRQNLCLLKSCNLITKEIQNRIAKKQKLKSESKHRHSEQIN